jgi:hypothetical protein
MGAIKWVKINRFVDDYQPFEEPRPVLENKISSSCRGGESNIQATFFG